MTITFHLAGYLSLFAGVANSVVVETSGGSLSDALEALWNEHVGLRDRVVDEQGEIRPHVNIFLDGENVKRTGGVATELRGDSEVFILPAVSGGVQQRRSVNGAVRP